MDRFSGQSEHTLDVKGRMILPTRVRAAFSAPDGGYLVRGAGGCLELWPRMPYHARLDALEQKVEDGEELAELRVFGAGEHVVPDQQGRILITARLQAFAGLQRDGVLVNGRGRIVEIWHPATWDAEQLGPFEADLRARR